MRWLGSVLALGLGGCAPATSPPPPAPAPTVEVPASIGSSARSSSSTAGDVPPDGALADSPATKLEVQLPKSDDPVATDPTSILMITKLGDLVFEGRLLKDLASLEAEAARVAASRDDPSVIIMADDGVRYGRVIEAIDALKRVGITKFAFGVQRPASGSAAPAPMP